MSQSLSCDVVIIGSGRAGGPLSTAFARAGRRTALIERVHVGGTCINERCTPTKTMVASARVAYLARRAADYGVRTDAVSIDMVRVRMPSRRRGAAGEEARFTAAGARSHRRGLLGVLSWQTEQRARARHSLSIGPTGHDRSANRNGHISSHRYRG